MRPTIVAFEGIDRSGKDTLRREFASLTGERYVTLSRFLFSNAAYDAIFGRVGGPTTEEYLELIEDLEDSGSLFTVFVDTPPYVCAGREGCQYSLDELVRHREEFLDLILLTGSPEYRLVLTVPPDKSPSFLAARCVNWIVGKKVTLG